MLERRLLPAGGVAIPLLAFAGLHLLHGPGAPEHMSAAQQSVWAASGHLWLGGVLVTAAGLALPAWAALRYPGADALDRTARGSLSALAGLLVLTGLLESSAGIVGSPGERLTNPELLPVLVLLYGQVGVCCWCLAGPAILVAASREGPRALRVVLAVLGVLTLLSLAVPPVSWAPASVGLLVLGAAGPSRVRDALPHRPGVARL